MLSLLNALSEAKRQGIKGSYFWRKGHPELPNKDPHLNPLSDVKRQEVILEKRLAQATVLLYF